MENISGSNGNDTLVGSYYADTINGKAGNDTIITDRYGNDTLTGGGGNDKFVYNNFNSDASTDTITDFGGVGKGTNSTAAIITEVDTIKFLSPGLTARNLLLTKNGSNLEITFQSLIPDAKVILQNFALENLDNLSKSTGATVNLGNIQFYGQTIISDSFDVVNANSIQHNLFRKNTVTFFNDLDNYVNGFDNSDDVINGQGGNDKIDGKSGNDLLRGGAGNNTLIGGAGNDNLDAGFSTGNNLLDGGVGNDTLDVSASTGDNLLNGGDGNDYLLGSGNDEYLGNGNIYSSLGNNTLNGGAGNDTLGLFLSKGDNLLIGGDGNDYLRNYSNKYELSATSGNDTILGGAGNDSLGLTNATGDNLVDGGNGNDYLSVFSYSGIKSGSNTLIGGVGNDSLSADYSTSNNLLNGGDGNDYLSAAGYPSSRYQPASGNNTLNGGAGDDDFNTYFSTGNNLLDGGDGNDRIYVSIGKDTINGGTGDDLLSYNSTFTDYELTEGITSTFDATTNIASITAGANRVSYKNIEQLDIFGTYYDDNIVGSNGNDTLSGGNGGNDTIDGGTGDDLLLSVDYYDVSRGITSTFNATTTIGSITAGTNRVSYKNIEQLNISGTAYNDLIVGSNGSDTLSAGNGGNDTIDGDKGDDLLSVNYYGVTEGVTSTFNPTSKIGSITAGTNRVSYKNIEQLNISGTAYDDLIVGSNGNDTLSAGNGGNDTIDGGKGDDLLSVNYYGVTEGITSTFNPTTNIGSITAGTNRVSYKNIEQLNISGTAYDDLIVGSNGNDTLFGSLEDNGGNRGNDTIIGGAGNDILRGGKGNGDKGNDSLYGGDGTDTFAFTNYVEGIDTIYDFNATNELIQVSAADFDGGLSTPSLSASQFTLGTSATTNTQRFIYNSTTGGLFFDQDGSIGAFTQVQFAQLSAGLSLTENNFVVV